MSSHFYPTYGYYITIEDLRKIIPEALKEFEDLLDSGNENMCNYLDHAEMYDFSDFGRLLEDDDNDIFVGKVEKAFLELNTAFEKATKVGKSKLTLEPGYIRSDDESPDIENPFFWVDGIMKPKRAGKKFGKLITQGGYVSWG